MVGRQTHFFNKIDPKRKSSATMLFAFFDLSRNPRHISGAACDKLLGAAILSFNVTVCISERQACRIVGQHRGTQRYTTIVRSDEDALTRAIVSLASQYGRYGYRRITSLLVETGWQVGCDRVQRIWRREGLKVPRKQRPRGRLWLNDGSCIRLRPQHRNHVWSYDFVEAQTHDGRKLRLMTLIDEFTRECLAIRVARRINSFGVIDTMADVMIEHGVPEHVRSDNGAEMTARLCAAGLQSWDRRRST